MLIAVDARSFAAEAGDGAAPIVREVRFVYLDTATGAETPVDSPSPQWFAGQTRLRVGGRYSPEVANEDLARFITKHRLLCREVRPEPVAGGVRVVFVFERRERVWAVKVAAAKGAPSVKTTGGPSSPISAAMDTTSPPSTPVWTQSRRGRVTPT